MAMADLERQLAEDKAMRDAAKQLATQSLANVRSDYEEKGIASRFAQRMQEGADGVVEDASEFAKQNPGQVASLISLGLGALLAHVFRDQLGGVLDKLWRPDSGEAVMPERIETEQLAEPEAMPDGYESN